MLGFDVGGKIGMVEKFVCGCYVNGYNFNVFFLVFLMSDL